MYRDRRGALKVEQLFLAFAAVVVQFSTANSRIEWENDLFILKATPKLSCAHLFFLLHEEKIPTNELEQDDKDVTIFNGVELDISFALFTLVFHKSSNDLLYCYFNEHIM